MNYHKYDTKFMDIESPELAKVMRQFDLGNYTESNIVLAYNSLTLAGRIGYLPKERMPDKEIDDLSKWFADNQSYVKKFGYRIKPGKFAKKAWPYMLDKEIADFAEAYLAYFKTKDDSLHFEITSNVKFAYHYSNYYPENEESSSLWGSCMRHTSTQSYLGFYKLIGVKVLTLIDNKLAKIKGRALLWNNVYYKGKRINLMDRIYTTNYSDITAFKHWAMEHNYFYKERQDYSSPRRIVSPDGKIDQYATLKYSLPNYNIYGIEYPYLDTMKFLDVDNEILTNDESALSENTPYLVLEDTSGGFEEQNTEATVYSEYYGEDIPEGDAVYSEYLDSYIYEYDAVYSRYHQSYILESTAVRLKYQDDWVDGDNVDIVYSEYLDSSFVADDDIVVYSEAEEDYILTGDAVKTFFGDYVLKDEAKSVYIKEYDERVILYEPDADNPEVLKRVKAKLELEREKRDKQLYLVEEK